MAQVRDAGIQSSLESNSPFPQTTRRNYLKRRAKTTVDMSFLFDSLLSGWDSISH